MSDQDRARKGLTQEIVNRNSMGDKKFHSETSLQKFEEEEERKTEIKDPGVHNTEVNGARVVSHNDRRRAISQPGPVSGSLITATAARAARKRLPKNVMYADNTADSRQSPKYLNTIRPADDSEDTLGDQNSNYPYSNGYRNADARSINSYRLYAQNEMKGGSTPRKRSVGTMDAQSIRSVETHAPPPTAPEINKALTSENLTITLSSMYAILIATLGIIIFIADPFVELPLATIYSIILTCIGFLYMVFLVIDINRYKNIALKNQKIRSLHGENIEVFFRKQEEELSNTLTLDPLELRMPPVIPPPILIPLKHDYCFSQGRHSGSFYLKLGAAGFALGHLVHSLLLIAVQINSVSDDNINNDDCIDYAQVAFDFLNPLYCFFQLYFIFKFSNIIIIRGQGSARFGFMHFIGSSLCFWLSAIVRETVLALTLYAQSTHGNDTYTRSDSSTQSRFIDVGSLYDENCIGSEAISSIFRNFSPYLYPFSVEFNILIVAVYYIIWTNIGNCDKDINDEYEEADSSSFNTKLACKMPTATEENDFSSNMVIHADCHASSRGLFVGMMLMVLVVGMLILGFVFSSVGDDYLIYGYMMTDGMKLFLHLCMLLAAVIAFNQTKKLDINEHPISLLDDVLLFICLPAFFMEVAFSLTATISIHNIIKTIDFVVMFVQVIIQTALIVDSIRRCSNSRKLRRHKPGREVIMFLIIANVAMWIVNTFSYKSPESLDERYAFYGKVLWTILGHISLPLIMFYRFHSSVCFADIWNSAYKPGSEH